MFEACVSTGRMWDAIVVDEAQDFDPYWVAVLENSPRPKRRVCRLRRREPADASVASSLTFLNCLLSSRSTAGTRGDWPPAPAGHSRCFPGRTTLRRGSHPRADRRRRRPDPQDPCCGAFLDWRGQAGAGASRNPEYIPSTRRRTFLQPDRSLDNSSSRSARPSATPFTASRAWRRTPWCSFFPRTRCRGLRRTSG